MAFDVEAFRARYRAGIHPLYSVWLHAGFVFLFGASVIAWLLAGLDRVQPLEWLAVPLTLLFMNWGEYQVHRNLGHVKRRFGALFYKRHSGDHHSFFTETRMRPDGPQDWRVIFFPAWLVVLQTLIVGLIYWVLAPWNANVAMLIGATWLFSYLLYEVLHACEHLPDEHPLTRWPWIAQMRRLHALHHRRELMQQYNFNLVFPLCDWLYGTLYRDQPPVMRRQEHHIEVPGTPQAVLDYARCVACWPQWHPSSLKVFAAPRALGAGECFEEDIRAAGRSRHLHWEVLEYLPGERWVARAEDAGHSLSLRLSYECRPGPQGCVFSRILEYRLNTPWMRLLDRLLLQRRIERESAESMARLAQVLVTPAAENG